MHSINKRLRSLLQRMMGPRYRSLSNDDPLHCTVLTYDDIAEKKHETNGTY